MINRRSLGHSTVTARGLPCQGLQSSILKLVSDCLLLCGMSLACWLSMRDRVCGSGEGARCTEFVLNYLLSCKPVLSSMQIGATIFSQSLAVLTTAHHAACSSLRARHAVTSKTGPFAQRSKCSIIAQLSRVIS